MSIIQAAILGLVQGLCEFLPVSSSGHLVLVQNAMGINGTEMLFFDTMLHLATLVAVVIILRKEIFSILRKPIQKLTGLAILATIPTAIIFLLFKDFFEGSFEGQYLAIGFLLSAIVLTLGERVRQGKKHVKETTALHALTIGAMQGVAILPGLTRSGTTIAGGLFCGLDREFAARFSFLLSIPAILGSVVMQGKDAISTGLQGITWPAIIVGMLVAGVSGFFAIRFMIRLLVKGKLYGFAAYMLIMGVLILLDQGVFHVVF